MNTFRIALANLLYPATPKSSVALAQAAIAQAGREGARILCFPECYVPGYRTVNRKAPAPDPAFLERAWAAIADSAAKAEVGVILGTERFVGDSLRITTVVIGGDGDIAGFQDKVQLDPSEEGPFSPGSERQLF